ncbi:TPA: hypothetical protein ACJTCA_002937 [Yersinia enterocolitica]|nr:hypothetical protein [Yersinia enterocolitica]
MPKKSIDLRKCTRGFIATEVSKPKIAAQRAEKGQSVDVGFTD